MWPKFPRAPKLSPPPFPRPVPTLGEAQVGTQSISSRHTGPAREAGLRRYKLGLKDAILVGDRKMARGQCAHPLALSGSQTHHLPTGGLRESPTGHRVACKLVSLSASPPSSALLRPHSSLQRQNSALKSKRARRRSPGVDKRPADSMQMTQLCSKLSYWEDLGPRACRHPSFFLEVHWGLSGGRGSP